MQRSTPARVLAAAALSTAALATATHAQTLDTEVILDGLARPVWAGAPPGDDRIFYCEQHTGAVRIIDAGGSLLGTPFLDVGNVSGGNEQGLLGMAFHPKFEQNGYVFVNYTAGGDSIIERWTVSAGNDNVADPASRLVFLTLDQPFSNHNAGDLAFSPIDGYLYIPFGDGGSGDDPACNAQNPGVMLGKMLRIDVDEPDTVEGTEYSIPPDNPFVADGATLNEIWAFGLRNPWRFSFDQLNGDVYIGDVGQGEREEVSYEPAQTGGRNYGWKVMEGELCDVPNFNDCVNEGYNPSACFSVDYTDPVHVYESGGGPFGGSGDGRAIVGGVVYRGCKVPDLQGTYFFADNDSGRYWSFEMVAGVKTDFAERTSELSGAGDRPSDIGEDGHGEVLIINLSGGAPGGFSGGVISRVVPDTAPVIADCDNDGLDDDCEIATIPWADMDGSGTVDTCESFSVDTDHLCVGIGGRQNWSLHAGPSHAFEPYLVMGTLSGTAPGLPFGAFNLPLNFDAYLGLSITLANNGAPFVASFGSLNFAGRASGAFDAAPGLLPASVVGLTANHAYATFDLAQAVSSTSNYTGLEFRP